MPLATRALAQEAWNEQKYAGIEEQAVQLWSTSRMMWRCIQRRVETENFARQLLVVKCVKKKCCKNVVEVLMWKMSYKWTARKEMLSEEVLQRRYNPAMVNS